MRTQSLNISCNILVDLQPAELPTRVKCSVTQESHFANKVEEDKAFPIAFALWFS